MTLSADPAAERQILVELFPYDEGAAAEIPTYLASRDIVFPATDAGAPNREYDGRLASAFSLKRAMHKDGVIGGPSLPSYGAVRVVRDSALMDDGRDAAWRTLGWDGRRVRILIGPVDGAYAEHELLLDGLIADAPSWKATEIAIPIADLQERLGREVETASYDGSSGFGGGADLKDKRKLLPLGIFRGMEPTASDPADLWFDVAPTCGLHSLSEATDGAAQLTPSALNPPPAGSYYVDLAAGRVRTGQKPVYVLRVSGRSAFGGNALTTADIVEAVLKTKLGFVDSELDEASFTALNAANSAAVGHVVRDGETGTSVIDTLINGIGGYYTVSRAGQFRVGRLEPPAATSPIDPAIKLVIDDTDLERGSFTLSPVGRPPWRIEIGHRRNGRVLTSDQVADSATAADRAFAAEEFRVVSAERAATRTKHRQSKPLRRDTAIDDPTAAQSEADRVRDLIAVDRETAAAKLQTAPLLLELADEVWVDSEIYGIAAAYRVVGDDQTSVGWRVGLDLWR